LGGSLDDASRRKKEERIITMIIGSFEVKSLSPGEKDDSGADSRCIKLYIITYVHIK